MSPGCLAKGIEQSGGLIEKAVGGMASEIVLTPKVGAADFAGVNNADRYSSNTGTSIVGAIRGAVNGMTN